MWIELYKYKPNKINIEKLEKTLEISEDGNLFISKPESLQIRMPSQDIKIPSQNIKDNFFFIMIDKIGSKPKTIVMMLMIDDIQKVLKLTINMLNNFLI